MYGPLLEALLVIFGLIFKWPWALIASGIIQIWSDFYNITRPAFPEQKSIFLSRTFFIYILGALLGVILLSKLGFELGTSVLGGIAISSVIAETIYFIQMIKI